MKFLIRRLVHAAILLAGVSMLTFVFSELAPGNFFDEMKLNPQISEETIAGLKARYALDQPLYVRYGRWIKAMTRGDMGFSFSYNTEAMPLIWSRAKNTLLLTTAAMVIAWILAILLGIWAATRAGGAGDRICVTSSSLLLSLPELVVALLLLVLAVKSRAFPVGGMTGLDHDTLSTGGKLQDLARHLVIPTTVLVVGAFPILFRHVRASMIEVLEMPFIRAARSHGIHGRMLLFRQALPAAANPLISLFGMSLAGLLSGSLLVEVITGWPGLGPLVLEAIMGRDFYVVIGAVMLSTLFLVAGTFVADMALAAFDPRIRMDS
jgi:peptide/nickel transport system permease protein